MNSRRGPGRSTEKEQFWRDVIGGFDPQRTTIRQWCAEHGVSEPSFYAWRRELKRREETQAPAEKRPASVRQPRRVRLLPVQVAPAPRFTSARPAKVMLRLAGGLRLYATLEQLAAVLDVLEGRSC